MKKSKLLIGLLTLATFSGLFAEPQAPETVRPYFCLKGGCLFAQTVFWAGAGKQKFDMGGSYSLSSGIQWKQWRFEVEGTHKHAKIEDPEGDQPTHPKMSVPGAMVNVFYDYAINPDWSCYLGVGAGFAVALTVANVPAQQGQNVSRRGKIVFAAQAMTGIEYHVNKNWSFSLGYKLIPPSRIEFLNTTSGSNVLGGKSPMMHIVEAGVRYTF